MIRATFFACGVFVALCGGVLLFVDRVVLTEYGGRKFREAAGPIAEADASERAETGAEASPWRLVSSVRSVEEVDEGRGVIDPPDWGAFGLLSVGGVTLLYALALPGRREDEDEE